MVLKNAQLTSGESSSPHAQPFSAQTLDPALDQSDHDDMDQIPEHLLLGGLPVKVELEEGVDGAACGATSPDGVKMMLEHDRVPMTPPRNFPELSVKQEGDEDPEGELEDDKDDETGLPVKAEDMKESGWACEEQGLAEQLLVKMEEEEGGKLWLG